METEKSYNPLDNIIYISLPEHIEKKLGNFTIDNSILIPIEIPEINNEWNLQNLSWQMIISAMLKIIAYDPEHENIAYYKDFVLAVKPEITSELIKSGIIKAENKNFEIAEELFLSAMNLSPETPEAALNLALVYEEHSDAYKKIEKDDLMEHYLARAFDVYRKVLVKHKNSPEVQFNTGHFYLKIKNFAKAVIHLTEFLKLEDKSEKSEYVQELIKKISIQDYYDSLFKEAFDFIRMGKEDEGIVKIKEFLNTNSGIWNAWFLLGWGYRRIKKYSEAKEALNTSLQLQSDQIDTLNELAICYLELKEYKQCRKILISALKVDPENIKIISNFGILSMKENKNEDAAGYFRTVLDIAPDDSIAKQYLDHLNKLSNQ